jgi:adenosylcobinamide kinase/adenosylcobinamide-phosphate guanylyltransferase
MGNICLVVGGRRCGKSEHAQTLAEKIPGPRAFIATCPVLDQEMADRIRKHQEARKSGGWITIEEPLNLVGAVSGSSGYNVLLIDCLTLWINNLMYENQRKGDSISEEVISREVTKMIQACLRHPGEIILVTNETGLGIVPDNEQTRLFLDLMGRCNQIVSKEADEVVLMVCGQPLILKNRNFKT